MNSKYNRLSKRKIKNVGFTLKIIFLIMLLLMFIFLLVYINLSYKESNNIKIYDQKIIDYEVISKKSTDLYDIVTKVKNNNKEIRDKLNKTQSQYSKLEEEEKILQNTIKELKESVDSMESKTSKLQSLQETYQEIYDILSNVRNKQYRRLKIANSMIIRDSSEIEFIKNLIGSRSTFTLCFSSILDGKNSDAFHQRCDNKSPTLTLYKSEKTRFGGFTKETWENVEGPIMKNDKDTFVFNLDSQKAFFSIKNSTSIMSGTGYFPCFGQLDFAMTDKSAYSIFPIDYKSSKIEKMNYINEPIQRMELTNNDSELKIEIIEVYSVENASVMEESK